MAEGKSREEFIQFLDYLGEKGLLKKATASARKTAAAKILEVLPEDEALDVTTVDVEDVISRFDNLNPRQYTPASLRTYSSRLEKGLEDFRAYLDNPVSFRPKVTSRSSSNSASITAKSSPNQTPAPSPKQPRVEPMVDLPNSNQLPIPLRSNLTVRIFGLPFDLTSAEATKISNIILAHAMPD